jgi:hypothetical protein
MSATAFDAIPAAVADTLRAWPDLAALVGSRVYVNRSQALPVQRVNGVNVRVEQAEVLQPSIGRGPLSWRTVLLVECYARTTSGSASTAGPLLQAVWQCLANPESGAPLRSLGVQAIDLDPALSFETFDDGAEPISCAVLRTTVRHLTPFDSLTPFGLPT